MAVAYPSSVKSFSALNAGDTIQDTDVEAAYDEITALEAALLSTGLAHHLKFVDSTYDIGQSGATRPRHLFLSGNATIGGTLGVTGVATFTVAPVLSGGLGTLTGDLLFTDATYDIGKSGATRPRDLFISRNATIGGTLDVTGVATFTAIPVFSSSITAKGLAASPVVTADVSGSTLTLADAGTATFSMITGLVHIYDASNGEDALFAIGNNASRIISQKSAVWAATSTGGKNSVEGSAGTVTIRNRTGGSVNFKGWVFKLN